MAIEDELSRAEKALKERLTNAGKIARDITNKAFKELVASVKELNDYLNKNQILADGGSVDGGDNTNKELTKQEILSKYKGKYLDLLIGEDGKHEVIGISNTKKPRYFLAEEWYNDLYAKGGNVSSIEKKVQEVNRLIDLANKNDISVIDSSSTWESPMKYKPIKYSNGTLYID